MGLLLILSIVLNVTFGAALVVTVVEKTSGYAGNSSLVPGIICIGVLLDVLIVIVSFNLGYLHLTVQ